MTEIRLESLDRTHDRAAFDCGHPAVTRYLRQTALQAQEALRASTKVAVRPREPQRILGYVTLISQTVIDSQVPDDLARLFKIRNLRHGAPAVLLAQLGVDVSESGKGIGTLLLRQAFVYALRGALEVGGVAVVIDAIDEGTATWYRKQIPDLRALTNDSLRLILPMKKILEGAIRR